jgi:hypothetical protein
MDERQREAAAWLGVPVETPLPARIVEAVTDPHPDLSAWPAETVERLGTLTDDDRDQVLTFAAFLQAWPAREDG